MIWFNGFPFLDNKEDHIFNVPVSHAMTSKPVILPAADFPVRQAETLLDEHKFQGFPIVEDRASKILIGYIGRTELQYAINRAKREGLLSPNAKCLFTTRRDTTTGAIQSSITPDTPSIQAFGFDSPSSSSHQPEEHEHQPPQTFDDIATSSGARSVDFSRYVDLAPLTVHPRLPLETVMEIFKKMGPRVILAEHRGRLSGLVTVKDCLKYQFKVEAQEHAMAMATAAGGGEPSSPSGGSDGGLAEQKLWEFIQWVVEKIGFKGRQEAVRLVDASERGGREGERGRDLRQAGSLAIVDGTENLERDVELEDRGG
jgi:chloride channel 3/4/5